MKKLNSVLAAAIVGISIVGMASCTDKKEEGVIGGVAVVSEHATVTVKAIDYTKRTITIVNAMGEEKTFKASTDIKRFDEVKVGDKIHVTMVDSLAVYLSKSGAPANDMAETTVKIAPKDGAPGAVVANTVQVTVKVVDVNTWFREVKVKTVEGKEFKVKVAKDVDLDAIKKGDDVVMRYTEALALTVDPAK